MSRWLDRYDPPLPVRCRGAFHLYATRVPHGAPRLVVIPSSHAAVDAAEERLGRLARAHAQFGGDHLPVVEQGVAAGVPFVALECDVLCDGEAVIARLAEVGPVSYVEAIAVVDRLTQIFIEAHAIEDASGPLCLGALSWANVLVSRSGELHLLGFGHNVVTRTELDAPSGAPSVHEPPEVSGGGRATPSADVYAFVLLQRSVLGYCELPGPLDRVFRGEPRPEDAALVEIIDWANRKVITALPKQRASMLELRQQAQREWAALDLEPAHNALRARLASLSTADEQPRAEGVDAASDDLTIGPDAAWLAGPSGERHRLAGRGPLRRILLALVRRHLQARGLCIDVEGLLDAGWPGENPLYEAGVNRVHVAISTLRKMGLRDVLSREDAGYRIAPAARVRVL